MAVDFALPQMGFDMTEARIARWAKAEGDVVAPGEVLAEIATEKVNLELVDHPGGRIEKILVPEGQTIAVGTPIVRFADAGGDAATRSVEQPAQVAPTGTPDQPPAESSQPPAPEGSEAEPSAPTPEPATPAAQEPSPAGVETPSDRILVSPLARRLAEEKGVDLSRVQGTGPMGRILRDDVLQSTEKRAPWPATPPAPAGPPPAAAAPVAPAPTGPAGASGQAAAAAPGQQMSPMRQAIARRMQESKQQIPHFYLTAEVRADALLDARKIINQSTGDEVNITVNDFIVKAVAMALGRYPQFNAWFVDGQIRLQQRVNIGVAVALDEGLIVPALLDCQSKSLGQISAEARDLFQRARNGKLKPEEFTGGTFSLSNLGMLGIDSFQAIINPPQVGILSIGTAKKTPVVEGDQIVVGTVMKLGLSCDHRATDGALGARFLAEVKRLIETPALMLL